MKRQILGLVILLSAVGLGISACGSKNSPASPGSGSFSYKLAGFFGNAGTNPMSQPSGLAISGDTLWVGNNSTAGLQAWSLEGSISRAYTLMEPFPVAMGPDGYVYIGDTKSSQIYEISPTGYAVSEFASTQLAGVPPDGVAVDATDAYACGNAVYHYSVTGSGSSKVFTYQNTFGNSGLGTLNSPRGMCLVGGKLWVADQGNNRLVEFSAAGVYQAAITLVSSGQPTDVAVDGSGNFFVTDFYNEEIQVFSPAGAPVTVFGNEDLDVPMALALDSRNNLYVADIAADQVVVFSRN
jgi:streptogramin lyase